MSMRKMVLKRSHRKSISSLEKKDITNSTNQTFDGTFTRETPGLPSASSARTRSKRTKNKTKGKMKNDKENSLPVAQSTMILDATADETTPASSRVLRVNRILEVTDIAEKSIQIMQDSSVKKTDGNKLEKKDSEKPGKEKPAAIQEDLDKMLEYKYKYERLCDILEQFKEQHTELLTNFQKEMTTNKQARSKLNNALYKLEADKFSLQEELQQVKDENEKLKTEAADNKKSTENEARSKLNITSTSKLDTSIVSIPSTPHPLSRSRRKSMLNENVSSAVKDQSEKCVFYEDVILDQQDILDFYSLLCGTSICKQPTEADEEEEDEDEVPVQMKYSCTVQLKDLLDGYPFGMTLNYQRKELDYVPSTSQTVLDKYQQHLPTSLKTEKTFNPDEACLFVKELADMVGKC